MQRPAMILQRELLHHNRGAAYMYPNYPLDYEIKLGDIGWFGWDGQFIRLFNVMVDSSDPRNTYGLPEDYEWLDIPTHLRQNIPHDLSPGQILCSSSAEVVKSNGEPAADESEPVVGIIRFLKDKGGFVVPQSTGFREITLPEANDLMHNYMIAHREGWFRLAVKCHHVLHRDDFVMITGVVKTQQWAVGLSRKKDTQVTVLGTACDDPTELLIVRPTEPSCIVRVGPRIGFYRFPTLNSIMANTVADQALFLNFLKARSRAFMPDKVEATAGPHTLPDGPDDGDLGHSEARSDPSSCIDPALEYILESSDCDVAITSDMEVYRLLHGEPWPDDLLSFLRLLAPRIEVKVTDSGTRYGRFPLDTEVTTSHPAEGDQCSVEASTAPELPVAHDFFSLNLTCRPKSSQHSLSSTQFSSREIVAF
ncbi:unnamed protein product [Somion occarium]|uniref:Uncharacterized protein n=1 Tax=Somion occarium TaxID=3059160 RepID=A0ABP1DXW2_9APHY